MLRPLLLLSALLGLACDTLPTAEESLASPETRGAHDLWTASVVQALAEDGAVRVVWAVPAGPAIAGARVRWTSGSDALPWAGDTLVVGATEVLLDDLDNNVPIFATVALYDARGVEHPQSAIVSAIPTRLIGSLIAIPAGEFTMGWDGGLEEADESPAHAVWLSAYAIDRYPATVDQYAACVAEEACPEPMTWGGWIAESGWSEDLRIDAADHPAVGLTYEAAEQLCTHRGLRLPSEAEWEKAARGVGDLHAFPWGGDTPTCALASFLDSDGATCEEGTRPVGSRPGARGPMGLHDTAGGAWEWVADWYAEDAYAHHALEDPLGPASGEARVIRSGAWDAPQDSLYLTARRPGHPPTHVLATPQANYAPLGVRCARSLP